MSSSTSLKLLSLTLFALVTVQRTMAGDPDILQDFLAPENADGSFFTFTGFRVLVQPDPSNQKLTAFKVLKASMIEFPALLGQSVSYAALIFPPVSVNPPHTHPRSAELLLVARGTLRVGFVDTKNKLFTQPLQTGDVFEFPKGLVHFQYNANAKDPALAISAFGSANAGTVSIPNTLFNSTIDDDVLALAFKTDVATIEALKKGFAPKA